MVGLDQREGIHDRRRLPREPLEPAWFLAGAAAGAEAGDDWMSYWDVRDALYDVACNASQAGARDWFHYQIGRAHV